jgi:hypothetical protein
VQRPNDPSESVDDEGDVGSMPVRMSLRHVALPRFPVRG